MGQVYGNKLPREGLSLLFDPANPKCYPGTGSTIYDMSGNKNNGAITGSMSITHPYMTFDAVDDYITVTANQTSLDFSSEQTILIWMWHTYTSGRRNPWDQAYGGYGTWTHEQGNNINYYYGDSGINNTPYTSRGSTTTPTSTWQMMTVTRDEANIKWYRNNVLSNTGSNLYGKLTSTTGNIRIGRGYAGYWDGRMGMVMAFKRALDSSEIQEIYEKTKGIYGL